MKVKSAPLKLEDINVGDEVYFKTSAIHNYDLYWKVIEKTDQALRVEIKEMGANDTIYIFPEWVVYCNSMA